MSKEQAAWGRLSESAPRGRYEHARSWQKREKRRANFRAKVVRQSSGCWLWVGQAPVRGGKPYPLWGVKIKGRSQQRSAFVWMVGEFFPELAATLPHRTQPSCGQPTCIAPTCRVNGMLTANRITPEQAVELFNMKGKKDAGEVAELFGISRNQVLSIWRGRNWGDVTGAVNQTRQRKVTPPDIVDAIKARHGQASSRAVAAEFNVSYKTVLRIWNDEHRGLPREQAPC